MGKYMEFADQISIMYRYRLLNDLSFNLYLYIVSSTSCIVTISEKVPRRLEVEVMMIELSMSLLILKFS